MPRKGGGGGSSRSSSSSARTYVDNSYNRSHGRVGMTVGTAVISRSSGSSLGGGGSSRSSYSSGTYVDNSYNRAHGRVGMPLGSAVISNGSSQSSSTAPRTYVDNSYNRAHGRVGMPLGSAVISSKSSDLSSSSPNTYVDNSFNRAHGRVGMPLGSAVISSKSSDSSSSSPKTYVDNSFNRAHGRVGMPLGSAVISSKSSDSSSSSPKTYVDNSFNRALGRVGLPLGSAPVSSRSTNSSSAKKVYVDNALNRKLGRVGKPLGSMPCSKSKETSQLREAFKQWEHNEEQLYEGEQREILQEILERMAIWEEVIDSKSKEFFESRQMQERGQKIHPTETSHYSKSAFKSYAGAVIEYNDIKLGAKIGSGGFGDIHSAKWNGKDVAVKKLRVQRVSRKRLDQFVDEIKVFCQLQHNNIVEFYGACIKTPNLCIVMELMEESLYDKLHINEHQFTIKNKMFMVKEMSSGMEYLHSMGVAHCDVKSKNVLLSIFDENEIQVKLTDFGLSLMKNDTETTTSSKETLVRDIGTPRYSAPEVLRGELLDQKAMKIADVYSFGLLVHELFTEEEPFSDLNLHQLREHVGNKGKTLSLPLFQQDESDKKMLILAGILRRCWLVAEKRPNMDTICKELSTIHI